LSRVLAGKRRPSQRKFNESPVIKKWAELREPTRDRSTWELGGVGIQ
jgi:hypothetical protein